MKNKNLEANEDLDAIKSLAYNVTTPEATSPMPEKTTPSFVELLKEHYECECHKFIGCGKLHCGNNLKMRHSRRMQLHKLMSDNSRKFKNYIDNE